MLKIVRCLMMISILLILVSRVNHASAASFQGLGDLPGGTFDSLGLGISRDGSVVVGRSRSASGDEAFRWTFDGGLIGLGDLPGGGFESVLGAASSDGSIAIGSGRSASGIEATLWTSSSGMIGLGDFGGGRFFSEARGVSADGSVVVGNGDTASGVEAFRWTSSSGMVSLGGLPDALPRGSFEFGFFSQAQGVSADGLVVVGSSNSAFGIEAFRYTSGGGMVGLGDLSGGAYESQAFGVSSDGLVVIGASRSASGLEAFQWTSGGGLVGLGDLPGGGFLSMALAASADGSVIVGSGTSALGLEAFVWNETDGMQSLSNILTDNGLDLTGWTLSQARGISGDGRTIVGFGTNPSGFLEAWVANLDLTLPDVSFDTFTIDKARVKLGNDVGQDEFEVEGRYELNLVDGNGIDPLNQDVTITFGTFTETILAGLFFVDTDESNVPVGFQYNGPDGFVIRIVISNDGEFKVRARDVNLSGIVFNSSALFSLQIGNDIGRTDIHLNGKGEFKP